MEFRTIVPIKPQEPKIDHASNILLLGSCFVENIGKKLEYYKLCSLQNPFGILFHPAAIETVLKRVVEKRSFTEVDLFFHNERWHSFEAHSSLSRDSKEEILKELNAAISATGQVLKEASHVVITLGTAWGYQYLATGTTVANCHKLPQGNFSKKLMEVNEQVNNCMELINNMNPEAKVIFTVSPVRHLRDGFVENQQSKARLITAVQETVESYPKASYFPSYEIMMDELRDYRFYTSDMLHPNQVAVDYIWNRFTETYMGSKTLEVMKEVESIQRGLSHRPFNAASEAHQKFLQHLERKKELLQQQFPEMKF